MKNYFVTTALVAAIAAAQPASAQDWTGPYVGAFAGINGGNVETQDYWCDAACDAPTTSGVDLAGGVTLGYNQQVGPNFVVGLEADLGTGTENSDVIVEQNCDDCSRYVYDWNNDLKWIGTIRGRAGLAVDRTMFFVTGGYAMSKARLSQTTNNEGDNWGARRSTTLSGYTLGAGVEHQFSPNLSFKAEFLRTQFGKKSACYMDFEGEDAGECWDAGDPGLDDFVSWTPTVNSARLGVNFRF